MIFSPVHRNVSRAFLLNTKCST